MIDGELRRACGDRGYILKTSRTLNMAELESLRQNLDRVAEEGRTALLESGDLDMLPCPACRTIGTLSRSQAWAAAFQGLVAALGARVEGITPQDRMGIAARAEALGDELWERWRDRRRRLPALDQENNARHRDS